jgi:FAD/FMN-containing dehydrogenase
MLPRREFLRSIGGAAALTALTPWERLLAAEPKGVLVNDVHSALNATRVSDVFLPGSTDALAAFVRSAADAPIAVAGGRHAMGGQQFASDGHLVDMTSMKRVLALDSERGIVEVEAGIQWPELVATLVADQAGRSGAWGIRQKQTGADRLSIGGALGSNVHGRGLKLAPFVGDVDSFTLVDARGRIRTCSRSENAELFRLAIGGYGLFGVMAAVKLRLMKRTKLERVVRLASVSEMAAAMDRRADEGFLFGDGQFAIDPASDQFLDACVFSCYRPIADDAEVPAEKRSLSADQWRELLQLAHSEPSKAFDRYSRFYLGTDGQRYWSDTHQLSTYIDHYHGAIDRELNSASPATEMISEVYVPRDALTALMAKLREDFRRHDVKIVYGTVRTIERDEESFLPWARERWLCTVINVHVEHTPAGIAKAQADFRRLFDRALELGGSFYLTYHRWATREQVLRAYPRFPEFLGLKRRHDPKLRFRSDWFDHYDRML